VLYAEHATHGVFLALVLYMPGTQAVQEWPPSVVPYPTMHWPAVLPPHPLLYGEHVTQAESLIAVLYVFAAQALQVTPESVEPNPGAQLPAEEPPQPLALVHVLHPVLPAVVL
jgi:hypothetical protein